MAYKAFTKAAFGRLPIGASFTDPGLSPRPVALSQRGCLDDFSVLFSGQGLLIKIHPEFAYRSGRLGTDEELKQYNASTEVISGNMAGFNGDKCADPLMLEILSKLMEVNPAGTPVRLIQRSFRSYDQAGLAAAISRLTVKPRAQYAPRLARLDGNLIRLTSDGVRLALAEGYKYVA